MTTTQPETQSPTITLRREDLPELALTVHRIAAPLRDDPVHTDRPRLDRITAAIIAAGVEVPAPAPTCFVMHHPFIESGTASAVCGQLLGIGGVHAGRCGKTRDAYIHQPCKSTSAPVPDPAGTEERKIDPKFSIRGGRIVKVSSGEIVPEWEPLILMRARDHLLLPVLRHYRKLSELDGCNDYHLSLLDERIEEFERFAREHPEWMKQPGVTRGAAFVPTAPKPAEHTCERCHRPNVWSWHAPSPLWNAVMRDPKTGVDRFSVVCPPCFAALVEEAEIGREIDGAPRLTWCFRPHGLDVTTLWNDADGRTWDGEQCLWMEPQAEPAPVAEKCGKCDGTGARPNPESASGYSPCRCACSNRTPCERHGSHAPPVAQAIEPKSEPAEPVAEAWTNWYHTASPAPSAGEEVGMKPLNDDMDARRWAREFCKLNMASDEGTMIGWFANAIMCGYDEAMRRRPAPVPDGVATEPQDAPSKRKSFDVLVAAMSPGAQQRARKRADVMLAEIAARSVGYEDFLVCSVPGETWAVSRACKEHPDVQGKPFVRMVGDVHPCRSGCVYERAQATEPPASAEAKCDHSERNPNFDGRYCNVCWQDICELCTEPVADGFRCARHASPAPSAGEEAGLEACPFCGAPKDFFNWSCGRDDLYRLSCDRCRASVVAGFKDELLCAWNRRPATASATPAVDVDELRREILPAVLRRDTAHVQEILARYLSRGERS